MILNGIVNVWLMSFYSQGHEFGPPWLFIPFVTYVIIVLITYRLLLKIFSANMRGKELFLKFTHLIFH